MRFDHVAILVDDLEAEQQRLAGHGVRFQGPRVPDEIDARSNAQPPPPLDQAGDRGGRMLQLTERVASDD